MQDAANTSPIDAIRISLVDGESSVRHARQLMLHAEGFAVRAYPTCAALLADPQARHDACIILDIDMEDVDGPTLLRRMRETGWRGTALLLDGVAPDTSVLLEAGRHGDTVLRRDVGDRSLLAAIRGVVDGGRTNGTGKD
ncbi:response regulator [Sphingomonas radiodurans]|uniref:response regulator n=1 Tax=Sphingomonas radiodurans TaxID=2890321 RepID=UPI001E52C934|nr:response regulator [Sphingomonas radiodurans]WBH17851.1 response regulator [Sphingomonas radiodurans]